MNLEDRKAEILQCQITQMGLLRLLTNRKVMGANVLAATAAWDVYHALCRDDRVRYAAEPPQLEEFWSDATRHHATGPNFWTDAYLAAFAEAGDYTIVTFDRGIRRHRGVSVRLLEAGGLTYASHSVVTPTSIGPSNDAASRSTLCKTCSAKA